MTMPVAKLIRLESIETLDMNSVRRIRLIAIINSSVAKLTKKTLFNASMNN